MAEDLPSVSIPHSDEVEFNRVNCLVWVLHESARSFSLAIQNQPLARSGPELSNAWIGVDVHLWHKRMAYQVAVYALLKAAIEVELFLSQKRYNSPVSEILSAKALFLGEFVENQLSAKHPKLVQWFRTVELSRIAGSFIPLFKKWSVEYAGSGVAGVILAISCCTAVRKLGSGRIGYALFTESIDDILVELMDLSCSLVTADKLHQLAIEAGFEDEFLLHFGKKVLPNKNIEDVEFWIGLVQKKLMFAFHREGVITGELTFRDNIEQTTLATLGIFAFLGRETRLFLSEMNIKDLDEQIKDFLSYLECGSLYICPEFNSLPDYQLFIEVVVDEIGWLDFYAPLRSKFHHDGRRSRQHAIQAEKEIILYTVLTVCYDVFSGYAHYSNSSQQPMDKKLLSFLLQSQTLLSYCLEEYWAAYDKSGESMKFSERVPSDSTPSVPTNKAITNSSILLEAQQNPVDLMKRRSSQDGSTIRKVTNLQGDMGGGSERKPLYERFVRDSTKKLVTVSNDIWMGTQLLFIDVKDAFGLLVKQLRGNKITNRERGKIDRTLNDLANLVPITILMLIPVSAVGHAAMLAAIKKYMPSLQLERTKKMEVESWAAEDLGRARETSKEKEDDKSFTVTMP
nr:LETM1-like protein [Tanacetum cinerariifolium]